MVFHDRIELYKQVEGLRKRPLVVYVTSVRPNAPAQMAPDSIPDFAKQLLKIPKDQREIDLLVVSNGGDPTVSWRMMCMLRQRFDKVSVLLPYVAYSAATLLALGADEIVMHQFSNLGPVDPQLTYLRRVQGMAPERVSFAAEDLRHYIDFVKHDVGISDQIGLTKSFELACAEIGPIPIGIAKKSSYLTLSMGEKLLNLHMKDGSKTKSIVAALNTSFYHHGYPVGKKEAKEIGLPIVDASLEIEELIWAIWEDFQTEMECNVPFDPLTLVLSDPNASAQLKPNVINVPVNLPPQLAQNVYNQIIQSAGQIAVNPVFTELFQAAIESTRCGSQFRTKLEIDAVRRPDLSISINTMPMKQGWSNAI